MCSDATSPGPDTKLEERSSQGSPSGNEASAQSCTGLSPLPFQPLGSYDWPTMPTQRRLQWLWGRLQRELRREGDSPLVSSDDMHHLSEAQMNERVPWPPEAAMLDALDQSVADTVRSMAGASRCQAIVLPPCDGSDGRPGMMESWAMRHGHELLEPPTRRALLDGTDTDVPSLLGVGVLVIPDLAGWFLRHTHGLGLLRHLIDALTTVDRPVIVGCNSWAWAFLKKAMNIDLRLSRPLVPQAYGAERLRQWLGSGDSSGEQGGHADVDTNGVEDGDTGGSMDGDASGAGDGSGSGSEARFVFRRSDTGALALATDPDGKCSDDYLRNLSAHSLGIPWVAWHVFRQVQRRLPEGKSVSEAGEMSKDESERTAWLAAFPTFTLPPGHEPAARLLLHAVLLHGSLDEESLAATLPTANCSDLLSALMRTGHLIESSDGYECAPVAYPDIRQSLSEAGFPLDQL